MAPPALFAGRNSRSSPPFSVSPRHRMHRCLAFPLACLRICAGSGVFVRDVLGTGARCCGAFVCAVTSLSTPPAPRSLLASTPRLIVPCADRALWASFVWCHCAVLSITPCVRLGMSGFCAHVEAGSIKYCTALILLLCRVLRADVRDTVDLDCLRAGEGCVTPGYPGFVRHKSVPEALWIVSHPGTSIGSGIFPCRTHRV